jgi:hypothetical protein
MPARCLQPALPLLQPVEGLQVASVCSMEVGAMIVEHALHVEIFKKNRHDYGVMFMKCT